MTDGSERVAERQPHRIAALAIELHGQTYAEEAGIELADEPRPLWQLLTLALLASTRISSDIAAAAVRELTGAGLSCPEAMARSPWQQRVDALGRAHYRRYDESAATRLGAAADRTIERYGGDLRNLHHAGAAAVPGLLQEYTGIGPVGADIFCREVQAVWADLAPYVDAAALRGAERIGLPTDPRRLAGLARDRAELTRLLAACVRIGHRGTLATDLLARLG